MVRHGTSTKKYNVRFASCTVLVFHDIICLIRFVVVVDYKYILYLFVRILDSLDSSFNFDLIPILRMGLCLFYLLYVYTCKSLIYDTRNIQIEYTFIKVGVGFV